MVTEDKRQFELSKRSTPNLLPTVNWWLNNNCLAVHATLPCSQSESFELVLCMPELGQSCQRFDPRANSLLPIFIESYLDSIPPWCHATTRVCWHLVKTEACRQLIVCWYVVKTRADLSMLASGEDSSLRATHKRLEYAGKTKACRHYMKDLSMLVDLSNYCVSSLPHNGQPHTVVLEQTRAHFKTARIISGTLPACR